MTADILNDLVARVEAGEIPPRPMESLSRLERKWIKRHYCGWCEIRLSASSCGAMCGPYALPVVEGVRGREEVVDLGKPCDMDVRRAVALTHYKPRPRSHRKGE